MTSPTSHCWELYSRIEDYELKASIIGIGRSLTAPLLPHRHPFIQRQVDAAVSPHQASYLPALLHTKLLRSEREPRTSEDVAQRSANSPLHVAHSGGVGM
jgi:hypothetical protein